MAREQKRRQQSLERKAAKRKEKRQAIRELQPSSPRAVLRSAAHWPLHECLVSRDWNKEGELVQIVVARRAPWGQVAAGVFLVDLGLLGVKSAFASLFDSSGQYEQDLRRRIVDTQPMVSADLNLAARIIREGIAYARQFGFGPDPDFREASVVLEGADPDASRVPIPLGKDGKPFFIAGPHDDVPRIMARLDKAVGRGNYEFLVPVNPADILLREGP